MYSGVVSSVAVMFERRANRRSGYKDREGGALSLQNQVCDQVESRQSHIYTVMFSRRQPLCPHQSPPWLLDIRQ